MSVEVVSSNLYKKGVLIISWPCPHDWKVLASLKSQCPVLYTEENIHKYTEESIILYTLFKLCEFKLSSSPSIAKRSKFVDGNISVFNGKVILTFDTQNNFSSVRKLLNIVASTLDPSKTKPLYKKYLKQLNFKYNEDDFKVAATNVHKGMKDIKWLIYGKMKIDSDKKKTLTETLNNKFDPVSFDVKKSSKDNGRPEFTIDSIKCKSALQALLVDKYFESSKIDSIITHNGIKLYTGVFKMEKDKVKKFVKTKILSVGDKATDAMQALAVQDGYFSVEDFKKITDNQSTLESLLMI